MATYSFRVKLQNEGGEFLYFATATRFDENPLLGPCVQFFDYKVIDSNDQVVDYGDFTTLPLGSVHSEDRREVGELLR